MLMELGVPPHVVQAIASGYPTLGLGRSAVGTRSVDDPIAGRAGFLSAWRFRRFRNAIPQAFRGLA